MSEKKSKKPDSALPITIAQHFLDGEGLVVGDSAEFDGEGITGEGEPTGFRTYNFHTGNIMVSVYESKPDKVRIEGSVYDEFITVLEGTLILRPDSGGEYTYKAGESLIVPKGYIGGWEMPERFRELIVVDTKFMGEQD